MLKKTGYSIAIIVMMGGTAFAQAGGSGFDWLQPKKAIESPAQMNEQMPVNGAMQEQGIVQEQVPVVEPTVNVQVPGQVQDPVTSNEEVKTQEEWNAHDPVKSNEQMNVQEPVKAQAPLKTPVKVQEKVSAAEKESVKAQAPVQLIQKVWPKIEAKAEWSQWLVREVKPYWERLPGGFAAGSPQQWIDTSGLSKEDARIKSKAELGTLRADLQHVIPPVELKGYHAQILEAYAACEESMTGDLRKKVANRSLMEKTLEAASAGLTGVLKQHGVPDEVIAELLRSSK